MKQDLVAGIEGEEDLSSEELGYCLGEPVADDAVEVTA